MQYVYVHMYVRMCNLCMLSSNDEMISKITQFSKEYDIKNTISQTLFAYFEFF